MRLEKKLNLVVAVCDTSFSVKQTYLLHRVRLVAICTAYFNVQKLQVPPVVAFSNCTYCVLVTIHTVCYKAQ